MKSIVTDPVIEEQEQPFWQYVLREFIFKTLSAPMPDDALYKKIRDAPFYGGPLPPVANDDNTLLSRGSVFRIPNEQWIFCQDDCDECESCADQQNPAVKWALKRVKRWSNDGPLKWDLQLTVLPQLDTIFESSMKSNNQSSLSEDGPSSDVAETLSATDPDMDEPQAKNNRLGDDVQRTEDMDVAGKQRELDQEQWTKYRSRNVPRYKENRLVRPIRRPGALAFYYPQERVRDEADIRLIMGIDQHGEKHLVHVVPMYSPLENEGQLSDPQSYRELFRKVHSPRVMRKTRTNGNKNAAYTKLIDRILDSLTNHRNFIEAFLFSERLVPQTSKEDVSSPYPSYPGAINDDERFYRQNDNFRYKAVPSHRAAAYPMNPEYQVDEQDQQYRRYGDMTREVNRPAGVYQDQSGMIEYEPYEISPNDHQHDERSSPQADAKRRRRNSRVKLKHPSSSTFGRQRVRGNQTQADNTHSVFTVNRKLLPNLADRGAINSQLDINQTDPRFPAVPRK